MKKIAIFILIIYSLNSNSQNENIEVDGIVTYFFNENLGTKADVSSKVYFRPAQYSDTLNKNFSKLRYFEVLVGASSYASKYSKPNRKTLAKRKRNVDSLNLYKKLTDDILIQIKDKSYKTSVDGVGRFNIKVPKGFYEIIVVSSNRKGRKLNRFVEIKNQQQMDLDLDFEFGRI